jgi:hypothetical protein
MPRVVDSVTFEKIVRGQGFTRLFNKIIKDAGFDVTRWYPSRRIQGMSHPTSGFEVKVDYDGNYHIENWLREYQNPKEANNQLLKTLNEVNILSAQVGDGIDLTIKYELLGKSTLLKIYKDLKSEYESLRGIASNKYLQATKTRMACFRKDAIRYDRRAEIIRTKLAPIEKVLGIE